MMVASNAFVGQRQLWGYPKNPAPQLGPMVVASVS